MLSWFDFLRTGELDTVSVLIRLVLAVICGGCIGLERERKHRPAGFRTHILICLGAAMTTLTSQYLVLNLHLYTDMARLGAQVIAGIGFIGAGTIIITKRRQVKGLTTAAGLWASAIVGLCCGAGFVEGAIIATTIILFAEFVFAKLEYFIISNSRASNIYIEYAEASLLGTIVDVVKKSGAHVIDLEITKSKGSVKHPCAIFAVQLPRKSNHQALMAVISKIEGVVAVEEL